MAEHQTKVQGLTTFYREKGAGSALFILHGWGSSFKTWVNVQDQLAEYGLRVIAVDLPGFGKTDEPPSYWSLGDYTDFVRELAKQLNLEKFALLGHSFGGRIAIDYAARYSEDLQKLILVAAAGVVRHKETKIAVFRVFTKVGNKVFSVPGLRYFKNIISKIWYKFTGENDYHKASPRMKQIMSRVLDENLRPYLPRITVPTLILWGEKDIMTPLSDAKILNEEIQNSYLHIFEGEPHALQITIPEQLSSRIAKFLT